MGGERGNGSQRYSSGILLTIVIKVIGLSIAENEFKISATYDDIYIDLVRAGNILKELKKESQ